MGVTGGLGIIMRVIGIRVAMLRTAIGLIGFSSYSVSGRWSVVGGWNGFDTWSFRAVAVKGISDTNGGVTGLVCVNLLRP